MNSTGIVTALAVEAACLSRPAPAGGVIHPLDAEHNLFLCGAGPAAARDAAECLAASGARTLLSFGMCGALSPELRPGEVVLPELVITDGAQYNTNEHWRAAVRARIESLSLRLHGGMLASVQDVAPDEITKTGLRRRTGAIAVDMESAAVGSVALAHGLPFLVLRAVVDTSDMRIPAAVLRRGDAWGRVAPLPLAWDLLRHPSQIPAMLHLIRGFRAASATLRLLGEQRRVLLRREPEGAEMNS